eukprot:541129_1
MALSWGGIISIVYFFIYIILLFIVAFIVYKQRLHDKVISKSFIKDVWSQRAIYAAVLIHFYDTATDIGILIVWYGLMQNEINGTDYTDVNMKVYFWTGFVFMMLYRMCVVMYASIYSCVKCCTEWYHIPLALLDMYILVTVYQSLTEAMETIEHLQQAKNTNPEPIELNTNPKPDMDNKENSEAKTDTKTKIKEVTLCDAQRYIQFGEAAIEAMPQVVLQSAFIIRSQNDELLKSSTPPFLLLMSLIASVISVANKYRWIDSGVLDFVGEGMKPEYRGFKFKLKFPKCINWWYLAAAIWRYCHIVNRFTLLSLIWGVCGGHWIAIYFVFSWLWTVIAIMLPAIYHEGFTGSCCIWCVASVYGLFSLPGVFAANTIVEHCMRWIDNLLGYILVIVFAVVSFDCDICVDTNFRKFGQNQTIDNLIFIGAGTYVVEIILFFALYHKNIFGDWSYLFN